MLGNLTNSSTASVTIVAVVKNTGASVAGSSTAIIFQHDSPFMYGHVFTPALNPQQETVIQYYFGERVVGSYTDMIHLDIYHSVTEREEYDNYASVYYRILPANLTHLACVLSTCTQVSGPENNSCSPEGSACANMTHLECISSACNQVSGPGPDQCSVPSSPCGLAISPDLIISNLTATQGITYPNGSVYVDTRAVVQNIGGVTAGPSVSMFGYSWLPWQGTYVTPYLAPGASWSHQSTHTLMPGTYTVNATADYQLQVAEFNESNNFRSLTFTIPENGTNSTLPDLTITSFSASVSSNGTNVSVTLTAVVRNIGTSSASYSYTNFNVPSLLWTDIYTTPLSAGASTTISRTISSARGMNYTATATADRTGIVSESNEANNQFTIYFST